MRRWPDYIAWAALLCTLLFFGVLIHRAEADRAELRRELGEERRWGEMTRKMLDARAEIQVMNIRATAQGRRFTAEETARFNDLCRQAEYDSIAKNCDLLK